MSPFMSRKGWVWFCWTLGCTAILCLGSMASMHGAGGGAAMTPVSSLAYRPADPLNAIAFDHFYNLQYERSIEDFQKVRARHPGDPFALNHLLTALMYGELYRMGALNTGEYAQQSFLATAHRPADPRVKEQIKQLVREAEQEEEKRLSVDPNDIDALYARGATRAQLAIYTALIERAWFSALRNAVGARHDHERVLQLDPRYTDAKLLVGADDYVTGSLSWGAKLAAALVGVTGNKEQGLRDLYDVANSQGETTVDAKVALVLFLRRERRYEDALPFLRSLIQSYPHNVLFALEEGALLRALARNAEAEAVYRRIWDAGREGKYDGLHYERAALQLGDLLRSEKEYANAAAAYELVGQVETPDPEALQQANLYAGEMYDLQQKRDLAVRKYDAVIATNATTPPAAIARRYLKEPYRVD